MNLFELDNNVVKFSPQALALKPFRDLWTRDRTKNKRTAVGELSLLYFVVDYRSTINYIVDEDSRMKEALQYLDLPDNWKPDAKFEKAKQLYKELQKTPALEHLESLRVGLDKVNKYCLNVDLDERDEKFGKPIHNPKTIQQMARDAEKTLESLQKIEHRVKKELEDKAELSGNHIPAMFEDGEI